MAGSGDPLQLPNLGNSCWLNSCLNFLSAFKEALPGDGKDSHVRRWVLISAQAARRVLGIWEETMDRSQALVELRDYFYLEHSIPKPVLQWLTRERRVMASTSNKTPSSACLGFSGTSGTRRKSLLSLSSKLSSVGWKVARDGNPARLRSLA